MSELSNAAEKAGTFIANAAKGAVQSVEHDAATLVGKNVGVGARIEAGVDLATDVVSVATLSPEDAVAERAGVVAIKEGIEHAPQIARAAEGLVKEGIEHAPEIAKAASTVFERTAELLKSAGHEIVGSSAERSMLETKNAIYHVVEGAEGSVENFAHSMAEAYTKGKNLAVEAPNISSASKGVLESLKPDVVMEKFGKKFGLSASAEEMEKSVATMEHSSVVQRGLDVVEKGYSKMSKTWDVGKKIKDVGVAVGAGIVATEAFVEHKSPAQIAHDAKELVEHAAAKVEHGAEHAAETVGHLAKDMAKSLGDDVKHWTPDMSAEHFESFLAKIRAGSPSPTRETPAHARAQEQHHDLGH